MTEKSFSLHKIHFLFFAAILPFLVSCKNEAVFTVTGIDSLQLDFAINFSGDFAAELSSLTGESSDKQFFLLPEDIKSIMENAGIKVLSSKTEKDGTIKTKGEIPAVSKHFLSSINAINLEKGKFSVTLGPSQFCSLYEKLSEEAQGYFDLLMIPSLNDEELSAQEYKALLASVYGEKLAESFFSEKFALTINGKNSVSKKIQISLGELFTLKEPKKWQVEW